MSRELTALGCRRFLFWLRFDGSFFGEMAKGNTCRGIVQTFYIFLADCLKCETTTLKVATSSRTDKFVHAVRSPLFVQLPPELHWVDECQGKKSKVLRHFNLLCERLSCNAMELLDFHGVAPGFDARQHVSYRKYVYRLCVPKHRGIVNQLLQHGSTLTSFSEYPYAWIVPPNFDQKVAAEVCARLEGKWHNYASFFKHPDRMRHAGLCYMQTDRLMYYVRIEQGAPYTLPNDEFDYFNIVIVSRGFLREQVRRIMRVLVLIATGQENIRLLDDLLVARDPAAFTRTYGFQAAPPNGLFLADVVYDPRMFEHPVPVCSNLWDFSEDEHPENMHDSIDI